MTISDQAPSAPKPKRVNLRRPDVMEAVQAQVQTHYRSDLVEAIRARGDCLRTDGVVIKLAKEFGFCYGVERAIDLAYAARKVFPDENLFILGEIIHNPEVNDQVRAMGIKSLLGGNKEAEIEDLKPEDVVIVPAFGAEVEVMKRIEQIGCRFVDTTCGDVMSVWKRIRQYSKEKFTSIIHGKAWHEETKATSSRATAHPDGRYLVVYNLEETDYVCDYVVNGGDREAFLKRFEGAYSEGFDPDVHLAHIGVANQTTMMRGETEEVQRRLQSAIEKRYGIANLDLHFRFFDTICGATQDRQDALGSLLRQPMDLLIVVGGYNSSNTSHLAEMGESVVPTYFIKNSAMMMSGQRIRHFNQHIDKEVETENWLPDGDITVGFTAGASCPNNLIEDAIRRILELKGVSVEGVLSEIALESTDAP